MKELVDVKQDMSDLYEQVKTGEVDIKLASELANIIGKYMSAAKLEFAKEVWLDHKTRPMLTLGAKDTPKLEAVQ